jgi:fumarylacetoacetase
MSWVPGAAESEFGLANLPFGAFTPSAGGASRLGVRIGDHVLDVGGVAAALGHPERAALGSSTLNALMGRGRRVWSAVREDLGAWLGDPSFEDRCRPYLFALDAVELRLPFEVADYVDFYSSEYHAANVGRIFRPDTPALPANWHHLPVGYHGRAGTVVLSGTPVVRPFGQRKPPGEGRPSFGPSTELDFEAEVGFVVGVPTTIGDRVGVAGFAEHVFGVFLLNDWSARDLQSWEAVPLGPFLGKSFLTSVSPWVVPLAALEGARLPTPPRTEPVFSYLDDTGHPWGLDLSLEVRLNGDLISRPPFGAMYWSAAQQLAHLTVNGASVRGGDIFASGTVSGPDPQEWGSLLELAWRGERPIGLSDGSVRAFLEDGDTLTVSARAAAKEGTVGLGEVSGTIAPARPS